MATAAPFTTTVAGWSRQSGVIGAVDGPVAPAAGALLIEHCADATIFVTAAFATLTARALRRCTLVVAPCGEAVSLEDCAECVISVAAPRVAAADVTATTLFAAAGAPVVVSGASRDVRLGPYNAVGDGLLTGSSMGAWAPASGEAACRLDARSEAASTRALPPADFYWRFLPVPQTRPERLALPAAFASGDASLPPVAEALLGGLKGAAAQRAEMLAQSKFVMWMLQDDGKANTLKHVFRPTPPA